MNLYGYKKCSTCRQAEKTLRELGVSVEFHDIVEQPPSETMLSSWLEASQRPILDFVNTKGTVFRQLSLKDAQFTTEQWIAEIAHNGKLMKRPILVTEDGTVVIGYQPDLYQTFAKFETSQSEG
ncbi:MAG: Spx/MgsR family RNA polymerase-binding regulatory protein [Alicyclobacillaceae bacterium]|nr:Spx/MgsR family RNA polymerase-binding regulatory protein [Alicyclobacillaceae bacterium]